jgi:N-dimethylarginine dimethylaminohydrolase
VVVLPTGNPVTTRALRERGCDVIEVDMSEFVKTGGGPHCATAGLIRDPGPFLPR